MNPADSSSSIIQNLAAWAKQPFTTDMDLLHWALFTGLVLFLCLAWKMVLTDMKNLVSA